MSLFGRGNEVRCVRGRFGRYEIKEVRRKGGKVYLDLRIYSALEGDSEEDIRGKLLAYLKALDQPTLDERVEYVEMTQ